MGNRKNKSKNKLGKASLSKSNPTFMDTAYHLVKSKKSRYFIIGFDIIFVALLAFIIYGVFFFKADYVPEISPVTIVNLEEPVVLNGNLDLDMATDLGYYEDLLKDSKSRHLKLPDKEVQELTSYLGLDEDNYSNLQISAYLASGLEEIFSVSSEALMVPSALTVKDASNIFNLKNIKDIKLGLKVNKDTAEFGFKRDGSLPFAYYKDGDYIYGVIGAYDGTSAKSFVDRFTSKYQKEPFDFFKVKYQHVEKSSLEYPSNEEWLKAYFDSTMVIEQLGSYFVFAYGPDSEAVAASLKNMLVSSSLDVEPFVSDSYKASLKPYLVE